MTMKQRITALLLAGLLTASLAACQKIQERPQTNPGGDATTTTAPDGPGTDAPKPVIWTDVDEMVYVISPMTLTGLENASDMTTVKVMDTYKRIKIGSNNQSVIVKNDKQYYALSKNLTTEDLEGLHFTPASPEKTLYADGAVNIRTYASSEDFSPVKKTLALNDTVTLVADGGDWYKIKYTVESKTDYGFVFAKYMSETPVKDYNDMTNYPTIENVTHSQQFVIVEKVNLRKAPSTHQSVEILEVLSKGHEVTVVGSVVVDEKLWYKVWAPVEPELGQSPVPLEGFISADCLNVNKDAVSRRTLADMLEEYTAFTKVDPAQTLYTMGNLKIRSTPSFPAEADANLIDTLTKATQVKVVAIGQAEDVLWAMIEYKEGEYYFASYKYLTTDPEGGEAAPTLEQLLATHTEFKTCSEKTVFAAGVVNCNTFPGNDKEVTRKLAKGDAVTVVATGTKYGAEWYIFETSDGKFFFAAASMFSNTQPSA